MVASNVETAEAWKRRVSTTTAHTRRLGSPGAQVLMACVVFDVVLLIPLGAFCRLFLSLLVGVGAAEEILGYVATGILGAQLSMLAIWLCLTATSLYWGLVALAAFVVLLLQLAPANRNAPSIVMLAASAFAATLPLAAMNVAGFRVVSIGTNCVNMQSEPPRYTLRSLFFWTFVVATILAVFHWIPATVVGRLEFLASLLAIASVAVATLWAVLRPGPVWFRLFTAPAVAVMLAVFGSQVMLGRGSGAVVNLFVCGVAYTLSLALLLAIYRRAGMRLVHKAAGGWLVR